MPFLNGGRGKLLPMLRGGAAPLLPPNSAFNFLPFSIYKDVPTNTFNVGTWDISAQVSRSGGTYYVAKTGNDSTGNGLSLATAWKSIDKAFTQLAAVPNAAIIVGAGIYGWGDGYTEKTFSVDGRSIIANGDVSIDAYLVCTFSATAGKTYTFEAAQANPIDSVFDYGTLDANGDPTSYVLKASIDEVEATVGSYFYYNTAPKKLYVHTLDGLTPGANVRAQYTGSSSMVVTASNIHAYMEGLKCYHMRLNITNNSASNSGALYFKNCRWMFNNSNLASSGYTSYFQGCQWAHFAAGKDGLSGNIANTVVAKIVEIDCKSWDVGASGDNTMNCTTNHNGGVNVIIGGEYSTAYGGNIAYIGSGAAWLLGVNSHDCSIGSGTTDNNYQYQENAWMDTCISSGSSYDISVDAGHTAYLRDCTTEGNYTGGGTIGAY